MRTSICYNNHTKNGGISMLKFMIQKGYVNVNKLLLENYHHFGLSEAEFVVLLKLFEMLKNNQVTISVTQLSKKMSMSVK